MTTTNKINERKLKIITRYGAKRGRGRGAVVRSRGQVGVRVYRCFLHFDNLISILLRIFYWNMCYYSCQHFNGGVDNVGDREVANSVPGLASVLSSGYV